MEGGPSGGRAVELDERVGPETVRIDADRQHDEQQQDSPGHGLSHQRVRESSGTLEEQDSPGGVCGRSGSRTHWVVADWCCDGTRVQCRVDSCDSDQPDRHLLLVKRT